MCRIKIKHIIEEIVRQVGHLPELYKDARSEKCKEKGFEYCYSDNACYLTNDIRSMM